MCGIAGLISLKGKSVDRSLISKMTEVLSHRGPDGSGLFCDREIGLGHQRLAIFDLSDAGNQPMYSQDRRFVIVYNGEVYNWPEIRRQLKNNVWHSQTDTETILQAYIERGEECLEMFNGMFAFAIWDKEKRTLFLARDRIGIKPLFYGQHEGCFYFSSEMKSMFTAGFPKNPNYQSIYDFLRWGLIDHSRNTFFKDIVSLEPGHSITIMDSKIGTPCSYWDLIGVVKRSEKIDLPNIIDKYNSLLQDAIDLRMRADVPVGSFLSGGIDSSVITSRLAKKSKAKNIEVYNYEFDTGEAGEGEYAQEVADWLGLKPRTSILNHKEIPDYFKKVLNYQEMPITSIRVLAAHKLYEEYKSGSKVVLEGHGGDHVGGGFEYYFLPYIVDVMKREGSIKAFEQLEKVMDIYKIPGEKRFQKLFNCLGATQFVGTSTQDGISFVKPHCFSKEFLQSNSPDRVNFLRPFDSHLLSAQYIDLRYHNLPRVLRYTDRASMAVGREARVPLLDHRIVELAFCSTERARVSDNRQRYFMREVEKKFLPEEILNRPKRSIVDPQRQWLQHELRDWAADIFNSKSFKSRGIFDQKEVIKEYERYCKEEKPITGFHIFQYINVELWFRVMIDS